MKARGWKTIITFWSVEDAHLARIKLERTGIPALVLDENAATIGIASNRYVAVRLQVPANKVGNAVDVLKKAGLYGPPHKCPACASEDLYRRDFVFPMVLWTLLILPFTFFFYKPKWRCGQCSYKWRAR